MKKPKVKPVKDLSVKSVEAIYNVAAAIQSETELLGTDQVYFTILTLSPNYKDRAGGLNYLVKAGAITPIVKSEKDALVIEMDLIVNQKKFSQIINQIKERLLDITKAVSSSSNYSSTKSMKISYSIRNHAFCVGEKSFVLKEDSNQAELCRVIFKDRQSMNKVWNWDELLKEWGWGEDRIYEKPTRPRQLKVYNAARLINERMGKESKQQVDDLLTSTMQTVQVNPKYLPKS